MDETASDQLALKEFGTIRFCWRMAARRYPKELATLLCLVVGGALLEVVTVGLTVPLLDSVTHAEGAAQPGAIVAFVSRTLQAAGVVPTSGVVAFALLGIAGVFFVVWGIVTLLNLHYTAAIAVKLRRIAKADLFGQFLHARYEPMSRRARGTVVNDINAPGDSLAGVMTQLGSLLTNVFNSLLLLGLLMYLSWGATLLIGILAIGGVHGWRRYADHRAAVHGRALYDLRGAQHQLQVDAIDGLKVVKAHGLEDRMVKRQDDLLARELRPELQLVWFRNGPTLMNELIAVTIVLGLGAATFLWPSLGIRFSMLGAFLFAIRRLAPSLAAINKASVELSRYRRTLEVIEDVLERLPRERRGGKGIHEVRDIQLARVGFAYAARPDHRVLEDVTATFHRGMVTAIVGSTGSGKSTVAHLLLGLYAPSTGSLLINGIDLGQVDLRAWRQRVGYVPQDIFVFNTTIRENIALGDDAVSLAQVEGAARLAQVHDFVISLPDGYDTVVGDRGLRLSGGQCQRLAIARAILRRPEVLIFDEATSALDNLTERAVYDAISTLQGHATIIVIAHRLSTIRSASQIVFLEGGRIVEVGTHDALMGQRGKYARLYEQDVRTRVDEPAALGS
ncbi:MAG: ABC transporter ATP-binding protein [Candidatus Omnitrophica bacterium]|nr:ABC transporter ATP-binding protein [Candidatus Omnitrophota bacterium]